MGCYKDRTEKDAKIYLRQVFGIKSIGDLQKNLDVLSIIEDNASDGYVLDSLVFRMYLMHLMRRGDPSQRLIAKWYPVLGLNITEPPRG